MEEQRLNQLYNLILNPGTRQWEREQLIQAKNQWDEQSQATILAQLEYALRPLALRGTLTPDVHDFYFTQLRGEQKKTIDSKPLKESSSDYEEAIFAGGCFWCMVEPFDTYPGVINIRSGYTGGTTTRPTYDQVLSGEGGHVEAVKIIFDPTQLSYRKLVELYFDVTDPTDAFGQFQDRGPHYQPVIYVANLTQEGIAKEEKAKLANSSRYTNPIVTKILPSGPFYEAEAMHQDFYKKEPKRYRQIKRTRKQLQRFNLWRQKRKR